MNQSNETPELNTESEIVLQIRNEFRQANYCGYQPKVEKIIAKVSKLEIELTTAIKERDEAREELAEEKETIRLITTDPTYISGTHYWIVKHDKMMDAVRTSLEVNLKLEEKNASLQTALRKVVEALKDSDNPTIKRYDVL